MKTLLVPVCLLIGLSASTQASLVYMHEQGDEKQIYLAHEDGSGTHPITSGALWHLYPDLSADGKRVVFAQGPAADQLGISVMELETGKTQEIAPARGMNLHPRYSGDGLWLAYSGPVEGASFSENRIHLLNLKTHSASLLPDALPSYFPAPSSDGTFVVYQRSKSPSEKEIVLYRTDSKETTVLSDSLPQSMSPALSADDRWVAFTSKVDGNWDIYVMDLQTRKKVRVTDSPAQDFAPTFKADGTLVFASDRGGHFELYQTSVPNLETRDFPVTPLVQGAGEHYSPKFSGNLRFEQGLLPAISDPARSSFGTARLGKRIYVVGGHQGPEHTYPKESFVSRVDFYDLETHEWHQTTPRSVAAHGFEVTACGGYLYAFGGFAYSPDHKPGWKSLDLVERFDPQTSQWSVAGKLPRPRSSYVIAQSGTKIYLLAGWDSTPQKPNDFQGRFHREIDVFDCATGEASVTPYLLPDPLRRALTAVQKADGKVLLVGGLGVGATHFELLNAVTEFDPETGAFRELAPLPFATFAPAAGILGDSLFVFGGMFKTGEQDYAYVNHAFEYTFSDAEWHHTGRYLSEAKGFARVVSLDAHHLGILGGHASQENGSDAPVLTFETFGIKE
jgi:hypothetical protein